MLLFLNVQAVILLLTILNFPKGYFKRKREKEGCKVLTGDISAKTSQYHAFMQEVF